MSRFLIYKDDYGVQLASENFDIEIETEIWKNIRELAQSKLSKYPTSYSDDIATLRDNKKTPTLSKIEINCIVFRLSEKKILTSLLYNSNQLLFLFANKDISDALKKIKKLKIHKTNYIQNNIIPILNYHKKYIQDEL